MKYFRLVSLACVALGLVSPVAVSAAGQKLHIKLAPPVVYDSGGPVAGSVTIADLRGNGKLDLIVTNDCESAGPGFCKGTGEVAVLLGNGDGTFQPAVIYGTGAYFATSVAVADVKGDGIPDLVVTDWCADQNCIDGGAMSVLLGNGDGTFQAAVVYPSGADYSWSVAIGDLTGDGTQDAVVSNEGPVGNDNGSVSVLLGNGDGTFQSAANYSSGGLVAASVAIGDLNGNGIPDLAVANYGGARGNGNAASVLLGNGDGTFQNAVTYSSGGAYANSVALRDLRGNGILDLVVSNEVGDNQGKRPHGELGVLLGNGDGTFQPVVSYPAVGIGALSWPSPGLGVESLAVADVNGDGIPDLLLVELCKTFKESCVGDGQINVVLGNGDGTFQPPVVYSSSGYGGSGIAVADVNGDGRPDVIAVSEQVSPSNYEGTVAVLLNETTYTTKTALTSSPNPAQINQPVTFTATIASTPAVPNGETVTFYNGKTEIGAGTTTSGVATLTTSFSKAKTYTIKATYSGDPFRKTSSGTVKQVVN